MGLTDFFVRDKKPDMQNPAAEVKEAKSDNVDLIDALLHNKDIVTKLDTDYGEFEFKYPTGTDQVRIAHRRAAYLGGYPDSSFDNVRRSQFELWATLDILVTKRPEKFKDMESWADCPDQSLADDIFARGARFCGDIRTQIRGPRPGQPAPGSKP